ncbi:hypothetical protein GCM10017687_55890 [Streptomyces echinatus]
MQERVVLDEASAAEALLAGGAGDRGGPGVGRECSGVGEAGPESVRRCFKPSPEGIAGLTGLPAPGGSRR